MEEIVGDEVTRVFGELVLRQECDGAETERWAYGCERPTAYDLQRRVQALERDTDSKRDLSDILPLPHKTETLRTGECPRHLVACRNRTEGFRASMTRTRLRSTRFHFQQLIARHHPV